jgi:gas vesicle protein
LKNDPWWAAGVVTGALVGAAAVLLYTPAAGKEVIAAVRRHFRSAREEAREAGTRAEAEILSRYQQVRTASLTTRPGPEALSPSVA